MRSKKTERAKAMTGYTLKANHSPPFSSPQTAYISYIFQLDGMF